MLEVFSEFLKKNEFEYEEYKSLEDMSNIRIGCRARLVVYPKNEKNFIDVIDFLCECSLGFVVLGNMSNVLFRTPIYNGVIIKTTKYRTKNAADGTIELGCGTMIASVARELAANCRGGFEGLVGIPGTVGGMIKQNAGAFGYEISDHFVSARIYNLKDKCVHIYFKEDMCFGYRKSILEDKNLILLSAVFDTISMPQKDILELIKKLAHKRRTAQPVASPSLGSIFKRCAGVSAGYYIDKSGLKGMRIGGAEISHKHAGFIVNSGGATAKDVLELIDVVKHRVYEEFGVLLEEEIEVI